MHNKNKILRSLNSRAIKYNFDENYSLNIINDDSHITRIVDSINNIKNPKQLLHALT